MDGFTMEAPDSHGRPSLKAGLKTAMQPALVIGVQHDVLFPVWQQKEIADTLRAVGNKRVTYYELDSHFGHDSFLLDAVSIGPAVKGHLEQEPLGAKHLWEEVAENAQVILQGVSSVTSVSDQMRSMFRALARGSDTVDRDQLQFATKIMFTRNGFTEHDLDMIFERQLNQSSISLNDFMGIRDVLEHKGHDTFLP